MIKRNKLAILLVAVVMMLTIYYIKMPSEPGNHEPVELESTERYPVYAEMRLNLINERTSIIREQEAIIASAVNADISSRKMALSVIQDLTLLTEKEVTLEQAIIDFGYDDALVVLEDNKASIKVLSGTLSKGEAAEIMAMVIEECGQVTINIEQNNLE